MKMQKKCILRLLLLMWILMSVNCATSHNMPKYVVAVIDTGINPSATTKLCPSGHKSYLDSNPLVDTVGHGSMIAQLIEKHATVDDYCILSIKAISDNDNVSIVKWMNMLNYIENDVPNISYVNASFDSGIFYLPEAQAFKRLTQKGVTIVAAAGNSGNNLDVYCRVFPACYGGDIVVVGAIDSNFNRASFSNYGSVVDMWEVGVNITVEMPNYAYVASGTSMSAAITTGKLIGKDK